MSDTSVHAEPTPPSARSRAVCAMLYLASGATLGLAWVHPSLDLTAWLSPALLVVALSRTRAMPMACVGWWAGNLLAHVIAFSWVPTMNAISIGYTGAIGLAFDLGQFAAWTVCPALCVGLAWIIFRRRVPSPVWLPVVWLLGEYARYRFLGISIDDWLTTQWTVGPVLRAVGHLGWWPAGALCLLASASIGQAAATRQRRWLAPAAVIIGAGLLLPSLPDRGADALRGIAAVHVGDALTVPHRAPPGEDIDLVIWPEAARHIRPHLGEGPGRGMHIEPLLPDSTADHLIGLVTRHPLKGLMNQAVAVDAQGTVIASRAKRHYMPVSESRWMDLIGRDDYVPGRLSTRMTLGPRALIPLICGELLSRALIAEGAADGGEVMIVSARDQMMVTDRALRHLLAVQVMRSVEYGVPSVRSSLGGWASFVSSDGRVLALSERDRNGLLMWDAERGARDVDFFGRVIDGPAPPAPPPSVAVLYSETSPSHRTPCPEGRCSYHALEGFTCGAARADTVIVAGHGRPPEYLSHGPAEVGDAIRCFEPELVVLDACYGASSTLFAALGDLDGTVVAAASLVPTAGLRYGSGFFTDAPVEQRAAALSLPKGELTRWRIDQAALSAWLVEVHGMGPDALRARLKRRDPPHVRVPLGDAGPIMVPVKWDQVADGAPVAPRRTRRRHRRP